MKTSVIASVVFYNMKGNVVKIFQKPKSFVYHGLGKGLYLAVIHWSDDRIEKQLLKIN